jgi:hypothetical protein
VQRGQLAPGGDAKDGAVGPAPAGSGKQINTAAFSADFNIASPSSAVLFYNWPTEVKEAASTNAQIRITFFIGRGSRVEFPFYSLSCLSATAFACRPRPLGIGANRTFVSSTHPLQQRRARVWLV